LDYSSDEDKTTVSNSDVASSKSVESCC